MSLRRELIANALQKRFEELCSKRISQLSPSDFSGMEQFVLEVREQFLNTSPAKLEELLPVNHAPDSWLTADADCLASLAALSLGRQLQLHPGQHPQADSFLKGLHESRSDSEKSFALLIERYPCPLNFALSDEVAVREYVLTRLMVQGRSRIEKDSAAAASSDDLLLKLNLVAINASLTTDLRFLDALNYYYELLPVNFRSRAQQSWLLVSYYALYAQALAAWLTRR